MTKLSTSIRIGTSIHYRLSQLSKDLNVPIKDLIEQALIKTYFDHNTAISNNVVVGSLTQYKLEKVSKELTSIIASITYDRTGQSVPAEALRAVLENYCPNPSPAPVPDWLE